MKKKKHLKIFAASSLALIMSAGVLCGVLAPVGATSASNAGDFAASAQSPDRAQSESLITPKEDDPVLFTTDYGLEIKYANALTVLTGYTYFTAGGYNWVIIGYDSSVSSAVGEYANKIGYGQINPIQGEKKQYSTIDMTPAGCAILKNAAYISSKAVENDEIGDGCVLCLCESSLKSGRFGYSYYSSSNLRPYFNTTYYGENTELQSLPIVPQTIKTNGDSNEVVDHLFPLATKKKSGENFYFETYFPSGCPNMGMWWLRTNVNGGTDTYIVNTGGTVGYSAGHFDDRGYRPAFVLKIV